MRCFILHRIAYHSLLWYPFSRNSSSKPFQVNLTNTSLKNDCFQMTVRHTRKQKNSAHLSPLPSTYSINFGNTVPGAVWSYWFVGKPNLFLIGTITKGIVIPMAPMVILNAMMGWRWISDLYHPFPKIPWVTPRAPVIVEKIASSWPSRCTMLWYA